MDGTVSCGLQSSRANYLCGGSEVQLRCITAKGVERIQATEESESLTGRHMHNHYKRVLAYQFRGLVGGELKLTM